MTRIFAWREGLTGNVAEWVPSWEAMIAWGLDERTGDRVRCIVSRELIEDEFAQFYRVGSPVPSEFLEILRPKFERMLLQGQTSVPTDARATHKIDLILTNAIYRLCA